MVSIKKNKNARLRNAQFYLRELGGQLGRTHRQPGELERRLLGSH